MARTSFLNSGCKLKSTQISLFFIVLAIVTLLLGGITVNIYRIVKIKQRLLEAGAAGSALIASYFASYAREISLKNVNCVVHYCEGLGFWEALASFWGGVFFFVIPELILDFLDIGGPGDMIAGLVIASQMRPIWKSFHNLQDSFGKKFETLGMYSIPAFLSQQGLATAFLKALPSEAVTSTRGQLFYDEFLEYLLTGRDVELIQKRKNLLEGLRDLVENNEGWCEGLIDMLSEGGEFRQLIEELVSPPDTTYNLTYAPGFDTDTEDRLDDLEFIEGLLSFLHPPEDSEDTRNLYQQFKSFLEQDENMLISSFQTVYRLDTYKTTFNSIYTTLGTMINKLQGVYDRIIGDCRQSICDHACVCEQETVCPPDEGEDGEEGDGGEEGGYSEDLHIPYDEDDDLVPGDAGPPGKNSPQIGGRSESDICNKKGIRPDAYCDPNNSLRDEALEGCDTDCDGLLNFEDPDDDNDGVPTRREDLDCDGDPTNDTHNGLPAYLDSDVSIDNNGCPPDNQGEDCVTEERCPSDCSHPSYCEEQAPSASCSLKCGGEFCFSGCSEWLCTVYKKIPPFIDKLQEYRDRINHLLEGEGETAGLNAILNKNSPQSWSFTDDKLTPKDLLLQEIKWDQLPTFSYEGEYYRYDLRVKAWAYSQGGGKGEVKGAWVLPSIHAYTKGHWFWKKRCVDLINYRGYADIGIRYRRRVKDEYRSPYPFLNWLRDINIDLVVRAGYNAKGDDDHSFTCTSESPHWQRQRVCSDIHSGWGSSAYWVNTPKVVSSPNSLPPDFEED